MQLFVECRDWAVWINSLLAVLCHFLLHEQFIPKQLLLLAMTIVACLCRADARLIVLAIVLLCALTLQIGFFWGITAQLLTSDYHILQHVHFESGFN